MHSVVGTTPPAVVAERSAGPLVLIEREVNENDNLRAVDKLNSGTSRTDPFNPISFLATVIDAEAGMEPSAIHASAWIADNLLISVEDFVMPVVHRRIDIVEVVVHRAIGYRTVFRFRQANALVVRWSHV